MDRSDEEECVSVVPGTVPPQSGCEDRQFRCTDGTCIPSLLRCDSVPDCPHGEDEYGCRKALTHTHKPHMHTLTQEEGNIQKCRTHTHTHTHTHII